MQEAVPAGVGAMAAVLGATLGDIERACAEASDGMVCAPANINSPNQIVIAGNTAAIDRAIESLKSAGAFGSRPGGNRVSRSGNATDHQRRCRGDRECQRGARGASQTGLVTGALAGID